MPDQILCVNCQSDLTTNICSVCGRPVVLEDLAYLNRIEALARSVIDEAYVKGLELDLSASREGRDQFIFALEELGRSLAHWHFPEDGCFNESVPKADGS